MKYVLVVSDEDIVNLQESKVEFLYAEAKAIAENM